MTVHTERFSGNVPFGPLPHESDQDYRISFGSFVLRPERRELTKYGAKVPLGSRALDILVVLVERSGRLVSKRELMELVWPQTVVVEANLTVHLTALRRALGDGRDASRYIVNEPGRGYRFVAPLSAGGKRRACVPIPTTLETPNNLPAQLTALIGRDEIIDELIQCIARQRLLTIVGPACVGKTAAALDTARRLLPTFPAGVWLVDLARVTEPENLVSAVAASLGIKAEREQAFSSIVAALHDNPVLLVLDNCERLSDEVAVMVEDLLRATRFLHVLATSRQALCAGGEHVRWLAPLEFPPEQVSVNAVEAQQFPAVWLLVERVRDCIHDFALTDADAQSAGTICRRLDGIPLAIEIAASRIRTFGLRGLASSLEQDLWLLSSEHRVTLPRHRSMIAALDWSYALLSEEERRVLRSLSVFADGFTLKAACVAVSGKLGLPTGFADTIASLVRKSLIVADGRGDGEVHFRLLQMTRRYAEAKLIASQEHDLTRPGCGSNGGACQYHLHGHHVCCHWLCLSGHHGRG